MYVTYFCYNPMNLVTMTTKVPTGRELVYCMQFSISLLLSIFLLFLNLSVLFLRDGQRNLIQTSSPKGVHSYVEKL